MVITLKPCLFPVCDLVKPGNP